MVLFLLFWRRQHLTSNLWCVLYFCCQSHILTNHTAITMLQTRYTFRAFNQFVMVPIQTYLESITY